MKSLRIFGFLAVLVFIVWGISLPAGTGLSLLLVTIGSVAFYPVCLLGRRLIDRTPDRDAAELASIIVHCTLFPLVVVAVVQALQLTLVSPMLTIPIPGEVGLVLMVPTGLLVLVTVTDLALHGLGSPLAIRLTRQLTVSKLYSYSRNPMMLGMIGLLLSVGFWLQSLAFIAWIALVITPGFVFMLKIFEEKELEIRFGDAYLDYKNRTPMLWPRRP